MFQSFFTDKLSQRIRHLRLKENGRSSEKREACSCNSQSPKRFRFIEVKASTPGVTEFTPDQYELHVEELQKHWQQGKRNKSHIINLMRQTREGRRQWMTTLPAGNIATILEKFPCLEEGQYVRIFLLLIFQNLKQISLDCV